jgi:hypothetical protein
MPIPITMPVDRTLLSHWIEQQAARTRARHALPERWLQDTRPEMHAVTDAYVELLASIKHHKRLYAIPSDDR